MTQCFEPDITSELVLLHNVCEVISYTFIDFIAYFYINITDIIYEPLHFCRPEKVITLYFYVSEDI